MPDKGWKQFERRVAKWFHGKRRGAQTRDEGGGKNDIICPHFSVEAKVVKRLCYQDIREAVAQAKRNATAEQPEPVAVVKRKHELDKDALVVMTLEDFAEWRL